MVVNCHLAGQPLRLPIFTVAEARIGRVCYPAFPRRDIFSTRGMRPWATAVALLWANLPFGESYEKFCKDPVPDER